MKTTSKRDAAGKPAATIGSSVRDRTSGSQPADRTILLVDDNPAVARAIALAFDCAGHRVEVAAEPEAALSLLSQQHFDAILLDLNFTQGRTSGEEGFGCLARILAAHPAAIVVVITAHSGIRLAVAAMQAGAMDFVMKPWRNADLIARVEAAIDKRQRPNALTYPPGTIGPQLLIGTCAAIERLRDLVRRVAPTMANVLISGPSGSGRSLVASLIHAGSAHAGAPLVTIDARDPVVRDIRDERPAFLVLRHPDLLDAVDQARLPDRLQAGTRVVGIVEDADRLVDRLRARLGTIELTLPSLNARDGDALLLARHFARTAASRHNKAVPVFTASAESLIVEAAWPGEVRGLSRAIEGAILLDEDGVIEASDLSLPPVRVPAGIPPDAAPLDLSLEQSERVMIQDTLQRHHHNISHAAAALGLSRQALYRRMERHGL